MNSVAFETHQSSTLKHYERYKFLFDNSPVPIHETNVSNVAQAVKDLKSKGVNDIQAYLEQHPNFFQDLFYDSDIFDVNDAMLALTEAESKEYYLQNFKKILGEPCFHFFKAVVMSLFDGQTQLSGETEITTFKGKKIWISATATYLALDENEIINYSFKEITASKRKTQAIKLVNERLVKGDFQEHLNNLVSALAEAYNLPYVFIGTPDEDCSTVTTLAFAAHQQIHENVTYPLEDTPCSEIYKYKEKVIYFNHLSKVFSQNPNIQAWNGKSYLGYPLWSKQGQVIGHFAFVSDKPIQNMGALQEVMEFYAAWASTELEHINNQKVLEAHSQTIEQQLNALNEKNQKLEAYIESNDQLKNFAYIASHDLKAPLRTITSFSQLLARRLKNNLDERTQEYLDFIISAGKNMQALIDDLLSYSTIEGQPLNLTRISLEDLLSITTSEISSLIREQNAEVNWKNLPTIQGDFTKIKQVFQNLISNAIKFRQPNITPIVNISCDESDNRWTFRVEDNGIGIKKENFEDIFGIFHKLHAKSDYEGTGLGLAICKKIVEKHGGTIWVESTHGKGTTFYFTLPKLK